MTEETIYVDNPREAHQLTGSGGELMPRMESMLNITLASRDNWIRVKGEEKAVKRAVRLFRCLQTARNRGLILDDLFIQFALESFRDDQEEELHKLLSMRIDVHPSRPPVFPRTFGQQRYVQSIKANDVAFGLGPAGTGKTYLAIAMAVSALQKQLVSRIILTRPAIEAGETLGFLPGDMHQKIYPYLRPLYDALYDVLAPADVDRHMSRGIIEVAPLAYMRGRTLNSAFVILDEAQNTTEEQMLMFLTRLGFDSKCVVTGDLTQIDLPGHKTSGLLEARTLLPRIKGISFSELTDADVVRHTLVQQIIRAYRDGRQTGEPRPPASNAAAANPE
jgi:phosphate starvation-inducible PhoH-like protein